MEYVYRKEFGLTAEEFANEPADKFFTNMTIYSLMKEKEQRENKANGRS